MIAGLGYSGHRFMKVMNYLQVVEPNLAVLVSVVDSDAKKLKILPKSVAAFTSFADALNTVEPDAVAVCVNEASHFEVLSMLANSSVRSVLCEKPLTSTMYQAREIAQVLADKQLSMNMVERFSPIVPAAIKWLHEHPDLTPRRIEFFWGKHRVKDARPTIGVCSEIIHPLDLVKMIFLQDSMYLIAAFGIESDLHDIGAPGLDSVFTLYESEGCPIIGQSSFAWPRRDRRLVSYMSGGGVLYRMTLEFDNPKWDCDYLEVVRINEKTGIYEKIYEYRTINGDFPIELLHIYKVKQFVYNSLLAARGQQPEVPLVSYVEALELQQILDELEQKTIRKRAHLSGYRVRYGA